MISSCLGLITLSGIAKSSQYCITSFTLFMIFVSSDTIILKASVECRTRVSLNPSLSRSRELLPDWSTIINRPRLSISFFSSPDISACKTTEWISAHSLLPPSPLTTLVVLKPKSIMLVSKLVKAMLHIFSLLASDSISAMNSENSLACSSANFFSLSMRAPERCLTSIGVNLIEICWWW